MQRLQRVTRPRRGAAGGDSDKFKEINEAYDVLRDPEKRKIYDEVRRPPGCCPRRACRRAWRGRAPERGSCAPQFGEDAIKEGAGAGGPSGMEDLFSMFTGGGMGGRRSAPRERRGENVVHRLKVGLEEMYIGSTRCAHPPTDLPNLLQALGG